MDEVRLVVEDVDSFFAAARDAAVRIDGGDLGSQAAVVSFPSMEILLKVLTANRWRLLRTLRQLGPSSIRSLGRALDRDYRGVHADVVALAAIGLIERRTNGEIVVPWSRITAEMALDLAA